MPDITCTRCGRTVAAMEQPPIAGSWGTRLQQSVCADCWRAWQQEQTLVMNHYGLRPSVPADRAKIYEHMATFLKLP